MIGCGVAADFGQLLAARCLTGVGSALQNTGAQLFLADISTSENRAQCLGTNQARGKAQAQSACKIPNSCGAAIRPLRLRLSSHRPGKFLEQKEENREEPGGQTANLTR